MNAEWISQKSPGLLAIVVGLGFLVIAFFNSQYRYFFLIVAIIALVYAYKQLKKKDTPFEKHERDVRRKMM
jgi:4-hydroxybenzoate polyprenyltransferase